MSKSKLASLISEMDIVEGKIGELNARLRYIERSVNNGDIKHVEDILFVSRSPILSGTLLRKNWIKIAEGGQCFILGSVIVEAAKRILQNLYSEDSGGNAYDKYIELLSGDTLVDSGDTSVPVALLFEAWRTLSVTVRNSTLIECMRLDGFTFSTKIAEDGKVTRMLIKMKMDRKDLSDYNSSLKLKGTPIGTK